MSDLKAAADVLMVKDEPTTTGLAAIGTESGPDSDKRWTTREWTRRKNHRKQAAKSRNANRRKR